MNFKPESVSIEIERALRDVSARRLRTHKLAKRELLALADQLEYVPAIVNSGSLATAVLFMAQSKDYYRYIGVEILIRIIETGDGLNQVAPQKDFFYHTLVDMIDNYTAQHESQPDDVVHRKIADRVAVMRRVAERLRKLKERSDDSSAGANSASVKLTASGDAAAVAGGAAAAAGIAAANAAANTSASPGPMTVIRSKSKKTRRTTAPSSAIVPALGRHSPLSASSSSALAAFDAKVAGLEIDGHAQSAEDLRSSVVSALSPRSARLAKKALLEDDDGAVVAPSREIDVPPPPPLPADNVPPPPPLPVERGEPAPPPLPADVDEQQQEPDVATLPRLRMRTNTDSALQSPTLPTAPESPTASAAAASPTATPILSPQKSKGSTLKKKRETLRNSPPRDPDDANSKRSTPTARPTSTAPQPPNRVKSATLTTTSTVTPASPPSSGPSTPEAADELKQLKMRLMLAAGALGTAQQALASDDSWTNQTALAKAQADYKDLKQRIADAQQRVGSPVVINTPILNRPENKSIVKLTESSSNSVRQRTASINEMTGHVADVKSAEEKGREQMLLELFGTISLPPPPPLPKDPSHDVPSDSDDVRTSDNNPADGTVDSSDSSTPLAASPSLVPLHEGGQRNSADSVSRLTDHDGQVRQGLLASSSARAVLTTESSDPSLQKQRPASSDGAEARLLTDARQLKRMYAAQEILETEVRYVQCLESMVDNYRKELERSATTNASNASGPQMLATQSQIRTMFSNAQAILNTNRVLLNQVRARVGQWDAHSRLGDVFLRIADFFKIYIEYANNYDAAHEQLDHLIDASEAFVRFCEAMELRDGLDLGLEDLLIMPVQRLPRYVMLLEALLKYTPAVHPDREALTQAVNKIQEISQQINDTNHEVEQRRRVFEIHSSLSLAGGQSGVAAPHRIFRRDTPASYYDHETSKRRRCHVYLFNDLLLITNTAAKQASTPATVLATSSLRTARTARIADQKGVRDGDDITNAMVVIDMQQGTGGGQHVLCMQTVDERDAWLADVDEAKAETIHAMISKALIK